MIMTFDERVNFYLGEELLKFEKIDISKYPDVITIKNLTNKVNVFDTIYDVPLIKLLKKTKNTDKKFIFRRADIIKSTEQNFLTLCKNRCDGNNDSVLLRCFNFDRHWGKFYNKPKDIDFNKKIQKIFWRGTTTGCSDNYKAEKWCPRQVNRFVMMKNWFNKNSNIDVGFSSIHRKWLEPVFKKYLKGPCDITYFLKYKYILSIEGNDKDSGLNWKLNSNSVVLMPKPRVTSWLMETTLIPNYHYVLLNDDFSDLEEKLNWCNNNQEECVNIIKNANYFMSQFLDYKNEEKIEETVINKYFSIVS